MSDLNWDQSSRPESVLTSSHLVRPSEHPDTLMRRSRIEASSQHVRGLEWLINLVKKSTFPAQAAWTVIIVCESGQREREWQAEIKPEARPPFPATLNPRAAVGGGDLSLTKASGRASSR